jgi:hypothetical protein
VACCEDASRVDAKHVLDDWDKFLHVLQVSLLHVRSSRGSATVIRVRLPTCRNANTLHIDGNSERIYVWVVEPSLLLNGLGLCIVAVECENDRRCLVDIIISRDVDEETSRHPVRRRHVKPYTRSVRGQVCRNWNSTTSACSCNWDGVVWVRRDVTNQSCLAVSRISETAESRLEVACAAYKDGSFASRRVVTLQRAVVDASSC